MAWYQLGQTQRGRIRHILQEEPEITVRTYDTEHTERKSIVGNTGPESQQSYYGQTQRGRIRHILQEEPEITVTTNDIELTARNSIVENTGLESKQSNYDTSKLKAILLLVTVLALVAGIIVLVVKLKGNDKPEGIWHIIQEQNEKFEECPDVWVVLEQEIVINCTFKDKTVSYDKAIAVHSNPALKLIRLCEGEKNIQCKIGNATCSSEGKYEISFYDGKAQVVFKKSVFVRFTDPSNKPNTNISQVFRTNGNTSIFLMSCSYEKDCYRYSMRFSGRNYTLTETLQCDLSYSDSGGHSISCQANVSQDIISKYGNGADLVCDVVQGGTVLQSANFSLPICRIDKIPTEGCTDNVVELAWCTNTSADDCNVTEQELSECNNASANDCNSTAQGQSGCTNTSASGCNATMPGQSGCTNTSVSRCNTTMSGCISANECKTKCSLKQECIGLVFNGSKWEGEDCCKLSWCRENGKLKIDKLEKYPMMYKRCGRK